jgi:hypothetical protein
VPPRTWATGGAGCEEERRTWVRPRRLPTREEDNDRPEDDRVQEDDAEGLRILPNPRAVMH